MHTPSVSKQNSDEKPETIVHALIHATKTNPTKIAVYCGNQFATYEEVNKRATGVAASLKDYKTHSSHLADSPLRRPL